MVDARADGGRSLGPRACAPSIGAVGDAYSPRTVRSRIHTDKETFTMRIPHGLLSTDALHGVIEAFITREGTDYGMQDVPLATKVSPGTVPTRRGNRRHRLRPGHRQLHDTGQNHAIITVTCVRN